MEARKLGWRVFLVIAALAVFGPGPCEEPELGNSLKVESRYLSQFLHEGAVIPVWERPAYYLGEKIDPASINNTTVKLTRASDGKVIDGRGEGVDFVPCLLGDTVFCPLSVAFIPGGLDPCDLEGDTVYNLTVEGLVLDDGTTVSPITISFRTAPVPAGYAVDECKPWWLIENVHPLDGITLGAAGDITMEIVGVLDDDSVYPGYDLLDEPAYNFCAYNVPGGYSLIDNTLFTPPYLLILEIVNTGFTDFDLSATPQWVRLTDNYGNIKDVALPGDIIPAGEELPLYVGADGSTYYAAEEAPGDHSFDPFSWVCWDAGGFTFCPTLDPPTAFSNPPAATW